MLLEKLPIRYIGKICLKSLRDFILDEQLTDGYSILLHPENRQEVALEYRIIYNQPMPSPCFIVGILIQEDTEDLLPIDRISVINNPLAIKEIKTSTQDNKPVISLETVYRCGWCSNIVNSDGSELSTQTRAYKTQAVQMFGRTSVVYVQGSCCQHRYCKR
jgi:hypothetical protein